jgi:hypothetical protein
MPFDVTCPGCGAKFKVPNDLAGKKIRCKTPGCGAMILVEGKSPLAVDFDDLSPASPPPPSQGPPPPSQPLSPPRPMPIDNLPVTSDDTASIDDLPVAQPRFRGEGSPPPPLPPTSTPPPPPPPLPRPVPVPSNDDDLPVVTPRLAQAKTNPAAPPQPGSVAPKSNMPMIVGGAAVGLLALVVIGLGVYFMSQPEDTQTAKNNRPPQSPPPFKVVPDDPLIEPEPDPKIINPNPKGTDPKGSTPKGTDPNPKVIDPKDPNPKVIDPKEPNPKGTDPNPKQPPAGGVTIGKLSAAETANLLKAVVRVQRRTTDDEPRQAAGICAGPAALVIVPAQTLGLAPGQKSAEPFTVAMQLSAGKVRKAEASLIAVDTTGQLAFLRIDDALIPEALKFGSASKLDRTGQAYLVSLGDAPDGWKVQVQRTVVNSVVTEPPANTPSRLEVNAVPAAGLAGAVLLDASGHLLGIQLSAPGPILAVDQIVPMVAGRLRQPVLGTAYRTGDAPSRNEKLHVSIRVPLDDPLGQIKSVSVLAWTGRKSVPLKPGPVEAPHEDGDSSHLEQTLKVEGGVASGKITFPLLADKSGKAYRFQLVHTDSANHRYYQPAQNYEPTGLLVEHRPWLAELSLKEMFKPTPVKFEKSEKISLSKDGQSLDLKKDTKVRFNEYIKRVEKNGNATVRWQIDSYEGDLPELDGLKVPPKIDKAVRDALQKIGIETTLSKLAEMQKPRLDLAGVPPILQPLIKTIGSELGDDMELLIVPLPGKLLSPGATWTVTRTQKIPDGSGKGSSMSLVFALEYTYEGVRKVGGRDEVYVTCKGTVDTEGQGPVNFKGTLSGNFSIEPSNSMVMRSEAMVRAEIQGLVTPDGKVATGTMQGTLKLERIPALR